jgi:hypothetical protein
VKSKTKHRNLIIIPVLTVISILLVSWIRIQHPPKSSCDQKILADNSANDQAAAFTPVAYIIQLSDDNASLAADYDDIKRKNIFGIAWRGDAADNLKFAKHMGYHIVTYRPGMQNLANASNIHFMIEKPENLMYSHLGVPYAIQYAKTYTSQQISQCHEYLALKNSTHTFPHNLANGWFNFNSSGKPTQFETVFDWQQKRVLDIAFDLSVAKVKEYERPEKGFLFGGLSWDVPDLTGTFQSDSVAFKSGKNNKVSLAVWTGGDYSVLHPGTSHEYSKHSDGKVAFFTGIKARFKEEYPNRKLIYLWEPYTLDNVLEEVLARPEKDELLEDVLWMTEGDNPYSLTRFADYAACFAPGKLTRDWVGSTQPNEHRFDKIKEIVGKAGIHGSWFGWFGRFNHEAAEGRIDHIYQVPNWHQLARCIPSWDNLCGVPLNERSWIGSEYKSSNSGMNSKVLYSRQHNTNKLFVVFMDPTGSVPLNPGDQVLSVKRVDNFFMETSDAGSELTISDDKITLAAVSARSSQMSSPFFSINPNPAQDHIRLTLEATGRQSALQILDVQGRLMQSAFISDRETDISIANFKNGTYFIRLYEENQLVETLSFVKDGKRF